MAEKQSKKTNTTDEVKFDYDKSYEQAYDDAYTKGGYISPTSISSRTRGPTMWENYKFHLTKVYFNFSAVERRREFWLFSVSNMIGICVCFFYAVFYYFSTLKNPQSEGSIAYILFGSLCILYILLTCIPYFAATVRRCRDIGINGWWAIGAYVLMVLPYFLFSWYLLAINAVMAVVFFGMTLLPSKYDESNKYYMENQQFNIAQLYDQLNPNDEDEEEDENSDFDEFEKQLQEQEAEIRNRRR